MGDKIKNKLRDIRRAMALTKPLQGYLGNQYNYWKQEYEKLKSKSQ